MDFLNKYLCNSAIPSKRKQKGKPIDPNKFQGRSAVSKIFWIPGTYVIIGIKAIEIINPYMANQLTFYLKNGCI